MGENGLQSHLRAHEGDPQGQKDRKIEAIDKTQNEIDRLNESNGFAAVRFEEDLLMGFIILQGPARRF